MDTYPEEVIISVSINRDNESGSISCKFMNYSKGEMLNALSAIIAAYTGAYGVESVSEAILNASSDKFRRLATNVKLILGSN